MIRWFLAGVAVAGAVGWLAATCHLLGFAPVGLISLVVGAVLGVFLSGLAAMLRVADDRTLLLGTAIFALVAVILQHAFLYRDFRRQWTEARMNQPQIALFRPEEPWSPREYVAREATPARVTLWATDAVLVVGAAVGVVSVGMRSRP